MMDLRAITDTIFGEVRLLGENIKFDSLDLTKDEQFRRASVQFPVPPKDAAAMVVEEAFWASMLTEEHRPCRPRLIFSPRKKDRGSATHWLEKPVPLNRSSLRKLTPTQGGFGYTVWDYESGIPEITGIEGRQGGEVCDFTISAPSHGALDVSWHCLRIVAVRAGEVSCRSKEFLPTESIALNVIWKLLDSFEPVYLGHAIRSIAKGGHGGAVWTVGEGRNLDGIQIGHAICRSTPPARENYRQRFKWLESVGHLAAVDGAVLIDSHLRVLGFGCFVQIPDSDRIVRCLADANKFEDRPSKSLGGGRHRSAIEFCCRFAPAAAVVVSEDGRISLMWAVPGESPYWTPFSILGLSDELQYMN